MSSFLELTSPSFVLTCAASIAIAFLIRCYYIRADHRLPLPPGPPSDPIIGHVRFMPSSYPWKTFAEWGKRWGGLISINIFGEPIIIINDPKTARELMEKRGAFYSDRPRFVLHCEIMGWDKVISFLPYGNKYRRQRKMMMQHFNAQAVTDYRPIQLRELYKLLNNLLDTPEGFYHHTFRATASTLTMATYGYEVESEEDAYVKLVEEVNLMTVEPGAPGSTLPDLFPILRFVPKWLPGAGFKRHALKANDLIQDMLDMPFDFVKLNRARGTALPSFVLSLLEEYERPGKVDLEQEEDMKAVSGNIYSAGVETTNSVKLAFLLAMVRNQNVVKRAQEEIDRVIGQDRMPTLEDRDRLPYIDCILKETLRWSPPVPLSIPHRVEKQDTYNGMQIPKGATVIPNIWQIMRDEHYYPKPENFDPDRFLRPQGEANPNDYDPFNAVFGFGRRICPGRFFAEVGVWLTIASILAAFDIRPALDDNGHECIPEAKFTSGFGTQPEPFTCSITPRNEKYVQHIRQATNIF